eukprot:748272-Hanusia_phi.AAC.4
MSASSLPEAMEENLDKIDTALDSLESALEPILATPWDTLNSCLEPVQKAKLNLMIAYTIDSLFFLYLKTQVRQLPPSDGFDGRAGHSDRGTPSERRTGSSQVVHGKAERCYRYEWLRRPPLRSLTGTSHSNSGKRKSEAQAKQGCCCKIHKGRAGQKIFAFVLSVSDHVMLACTVWQ